MAISDVFINFRGRELRGNFIRNVVAALDDCGFNYYIGRDELQSISLEVVFTRIEESKIALAIFSKHYGESDWCLNELWKIMRQVEEEKLRVIPIFFNVTPNDVACQVGDFGTNLTQGGRFYLPDMIQWKKDLSSVVNIMGLCLPNYRDEQDFVANIISEVKRVLATIPSDDSSEQHLRGATLPPYEQRLKELEQRLDFDSDVTQIVVIVGVVGIGKTKLAKTHYRKWEKKFICKEIFLGLSDDKSETGGEILLFNSSLLFKNRCFVVVDDVSEEKKKQIDFLLNNLNRIQKGSKIVITTRDKSWIKGMVHDTYEVPGLNDTEALQLFSYYALYGGQDNTTPPTENIINMSKQFVHYAGGNPRALKELGKELCGKDEARWRDELDEFPRCWNEKISTGFSISSYNEPDGIIINTKTVETTLVETVQAEAKSTSDDDSVNLTIHDEYKTFGIKQRLEELEDKLDLNKIASQLGILYISCLLLLIFCLQQIAYMTTPFIGEGGAIEPNVLEYIPADKVTQVPTGKYGAKPERSSSDAQTNADFLARTCTNSPMDSKVKPPNIQVFINFRGDQLRKYFISYLADALGKSGINIFIDTKANIGDELNNLFLRIEDSGIAIVVFSSRYTESEWCLNELVKIKERVQQGLLKVLPIFYKVTPGNVKRLKGEFGDNFRDKEYIYASDEPKIKRWKEAIVFVSHLFALTFDDRSSVLEIDFIETIVKEVLKMLHTISTVERGQFCVVNENSGRNINTPDQKSFIEDDEISLKNSWRGTSSIFARARLDLSIATTWDKSSETTTVVTLYSSISFFG